MPRFVSLKNSKIFIEIDSARDENFPNVLNL